MSHKTTADMRTYGFLTLGLLIMSACGPGENMRIAQGAIWGTTYHIKYMSDNDLSDSIIDVMHKVDMSLSPFQPNSLISAVNSGLRVQADDMLAEVLGMSQRVCSISGGAFDPTVSPLINLWGFGYRQGAADRPSQQQIDSALSSVGILACRIDSDGYIIRKSEDTEFNFSAIAKGYGIDRIAQMLRRNGCNDYMVEVGGEMALSGNGPSGDRWRIQIDAPIAEDGTPSHKGAGMLQVTDAGIATSGNYRNRRSTSEGEVGHTISPVTGYPVISNILSATVVAPSTALADALATSIMAMPDSAAMSMVEALPGIEAYIIMDDDDGGYRIVTSSGWPD